MSKTVFWYFVSDERDCVLREEDIPHPVRHVCYERHHLFSRSARIPEDPALGLVRTGHAQN